MYYISECYGVFYSVNNMFLVHFTMYTVHIVLSVNVMGHFIKYKLLYAICEGNWDILQGVQRVICECVLQCVKHAICEGDAMDWKVIRHFIAYVRNMFLE